jgi:hypothetical protein
MGGQALAQENQAPGFRLGIRVGATISNFSNTQPYTTEKLGITIGGVVEYSLSEKFSIQAEPAYMQQGGQYLKFSDDSRFGDASILAVRTVASRITAHYIDIPLLAKYKFSALGNFNPNIVLGGSFGYLLNASDNFIKTYHYSQSYFTVYGKQNISSEFEKMQLGITAGIGGDVSVGSKRLLIDLRYRYGITNAKKSFSYIDLYNVQGDLRTDSFYFTVGLGL